MNQLSNLTVKIIFVFLSSAYLMSCTGGNVSSSFGSSGSSLVDRGPDGTSSGIVDPSMFYVGIDSTVNDIAHVRLKDDFSKTCSIDPKTSLSDITCTIDIPEAELYMHGLAMKYNVPSGMCRYLRRSTYWFYNHDIGYGPTSITVNRTYTDGALTASSCSFDGGAAGSCAGLEAVVNTAAATPEITCVYDHSKIKNRKNGCLGSYLLTLNTRTIVTTTVPGSDTSATSTSVNAWGGNIAELIGGAARYGGWPLDADGYPLVMVTPAHMGLLNEVYSLPAPIISNSSNSTMELSNFYTPAINTHDGFVSARVSTYPYALDPIDDFSGSGLYSTNDNYSFNCVDQAEEIIHRARIYVREWDTYQDFYDYIVSGGVTENPDRNVGVEGGNCNGIEGPCNDYFDADDIAVGFVSFSTNLPGDINRRPSYFPTILPK